MASNLIYYGISLTLGFLFSFAVWKSERRRPWIIAAALITPPVWLLILARFDIGHLDSLASISSLLDIKRHLPNHVGRGAIAPGIVAMLETFFAFSTIWIERNRRARAPERGTAY